MKHLSYVDFWGKMFIFYLFFVDVHNWHGAPAVGPILQLPWCQSWCCQKSVYKTSWLPRLYPIIIHNRKVFLNYLFTIWFLFSHNSYLCMYFDNYYFHGVHTSVRSLDFQPTVTPVLSFSSLSHSSRGLKYSLKAAVSILGSPVMTSMTSFMCTYCDMFSSSSAL